MSSHFWDARFSSDVYAYGREPNDFLRAHAHLIPPGPVLCLAEGEGRNAVFLAERGHAVTAVDFSREGLRKAQQLAQARGVAVTTVLADLADYQPEPMGYAGIVAIFAHVPRDVRQRVHRWVTTALSPGGVFVLEAYTPDQVALATGGPKDPTLLATLEELTQELSPLEVVIGRQTRRAIHEGAYHDGLSATVQLVATRR